MMSSSRAASDAAAEAEFSRAFAEAVVAPRKKRRGRPRNAKRDWEIFQAVREMARHYPISPPNSEPKRATRRPLKSAIRPGSPTGRLSVFDVVAALFQARARRLKRPELYVTAKIVVNVYYEIKRRIGQPLEGAEDIFGNSSKRR